MYTPLEQFRIIPLISLFNDRLSFTNSSLILLIALSIFTGIFYLIGKNATIVPSAWQSVAESFYDFIQTMIQDTIGEKGKRYFPIIFYLFLFIFACNIIGMIPYSFTVTSHIIVTFGLALSIFIGINIIGLSLHKLHFFSLFLPAGAPKALAPFLIVVEVISYIFRVFSLSIRLFANMLSGHCLLKILAGFGWTMLSMGGIFTILHLLPLSIVFALTGLELAIAFLQAYVFTILTCIYLNDAINLH
jgi:ATP synthase subunit 6